jgi:hypothetical protein
MQVDARSRRLNADQHHLGFALRTGGALKRSRWNGGRQALGLGHGASLHKKAGAQHSRSPVLPGARTGDGASIRRRELSRESIRAPGADSACTNPSVCGATEGGQYVETQQKMRKRMKQRLTSHCRPACRWCRPARHPNGWSSFRSAGRRCGGGTCALRAGSTKPDRAAPSTRVSCVLLGGSPGLFERLFAGARLWIETAARQAIPIKELRWAAIRKADLIVAAVRNGFVLDDTNGRAPCQRLKRRPAI